MIRLHFFTSESNSWQEKSVCPSNTGKSLGKPNHDIMATLCATSDHTWLRSSHRQSK